MLNEAIFDNAPLYKAVAAYVKEAPARFHTPGHKGSVTAPCGFLGEMLSYDVTELPGTDSLFDASGAIMEAEKRADSAFGMGQTLLSAGGATLCIQAMLRLVSAQGKRRVVMARNIHKSAVNAMALLGLEPVWVWPRGFEGSSLPGQIVPEDVERALLKTGGVAAVYLTSPDYYGVISDIRAIALVCKKHGVPLLVDNAHGAHLLCLDGGAMHPARLGAAMTCDSAHKTLPVLTGGAWLQIAGGADREQAKAAMALFGSTSPSYPVMLSLDLARAWMEYEGAQAFVKLRGRVDEINRLCETRGFFRAEAVFDPVRITIDTASAGLSGSAAASLLRQGGVSPEMADDRQLVLLPSPFNSDDDFDRLQKALLALPLTGGTRVQPAERVIPAQLMTPREALEAQGETVEIACSSGRIAAESRCPCPPGVPLVMPGEQISEKLAKALKNYGVLYIKVVR
jgi:arginine decarboxylase